MKQQNAGGCATQQICTAQQIGGGAHQCHVQGYPSQWKSTHHDNLLQVVLVLLRYGFILIRVPVGNYRSSVRGLVGGWLAALLMLYSYDKCRLRPMAMTFRAQYSSV